MYKGVFTALVTPFNREKKLDIGKLRELTELQVKAGISGLVPVGTTGESPTLSEDEILTIIETVVQQTGKRVPVIAGAGANSTDKAVSMSRKAKDLGADATLQVVPYYNKPTQEGILKHFLTIADSVDIPVVLYDVPGRTGTGMAKETVLKLSEHPGIVALKAANGSIVDMMDLKSSLPGDFSILSGDDNLLFPFLSLGGHGVISVASNMYPESTSAIADLFFSGNIDASRELHYKMLPFFKSLFIESNPIPIKAAMAEKGYILEEYRLPLCCLSANNRESVKKIVAGCDAINLK